MSDDKGLSEDVWTVLKELRDLVRWLCQTERAIGGADLVTVIEAARRLGVHPNTVRKWIRDPAVTKYRKGRVVRIRLSDLEDELRKPGARCVASSDERAAEIIRRRQRPPA